MGQTYYIRHCKYCGDPFGDENERNAESQRSSHEATCDNNHNTVEDDY